MVHLHGTGGKGGFMNAKCLITMGVVLSTTLTLTAHGEPSSAAKDRQTLYAVLYGGWSHNDSGTLEGTATDTTYSYSPWWGWIHTEIATYPVNNEFESSDSALIGGRVGIWMADKRPSIGFAGDVSIFQIDAGPNNTTIKVAPFSALLLYRYPLQVSKDFPSGRFQPHAGVGAAILYGDISTRILRADGATIQKSVQSAGYGGSLHVGCVWQQTPKTGIFFEYRYLYATMYGSWDEYSDVPSDTVVDLETSGISAHQLLTGLVVSF